MKSKAKREEIVNPDIEKALDVLSNILIDMYLEMTPEQRKSFIRESNEKKKKK